MKKTIEFKKNKKGLKYRVEFKSFSELGSVISKRYRESTGQIYSETVKISDICRCIIHRLYRAGDLELLNELVCELLSHNLENGNTLSKSELFSHALKHLVVLKGGLRHQQFSSFGVGKTDDDCELSSDETILNRAIADDIWMEDYRAPRYVKLKTNADIIKTILDKKKAGMSVRQIAADVGISKSHVADIIAGRKCSNVSNICAASSIKVKHRKLSFDEIEQIRKLLYAGLTVGAISKRLSRHYSTVDRFVKRDFICRRHYANDKTTGSDS